MILVDTGPLVALANAADQHHERCVAWLDAAADTRLLVPPTVIAEVCHLLQTRAGVHVEADFLEAFTGDLELAPLIPEDLPRMAELVRQYRYLPLGGVDASVVAIAERLGLTDIATIDKKHFSVVRPRHTDAFTLLPE